MSNLEILTMINNFPIGDIPKDRIELLSKAGIIAFLSKFQEQFETIENIDEREAVVKTFLAEVLALNENERFPGLRLAESVLNLTPGFVRDFGKVQYIKETNPEFNRTYDMLADGIGLIKDAPSKSR